MPPRQPDIADIYPLSPIQHGIFFHSLYAAQPWLYGVQWSCTLQGPVNVTLFQRAWQHVVARHAVLRTAFHWELREEPFQVVYKHVELPWHYEDWRQLPATAQQQRLETFLLRDRLQGFRFTAAPLMRLSLFHLSAETYQFTWTFHHLLFDGWSRPLLLGEVLQTYDALLEGRQAVLPERRPYRHYITWQQQRDMRPADTFWQQLLTGFCTPTVLLMARVPSPGAAPVIDFAEQQQQLPANLTADLRQFVQQHHLSLNTLLQGAWALLLSRYSGQHDVVFGTTVAGRPPDLTDSALMIGLFMNTLPVRLQVASQALLVPWLQELQLQQAEARHYEYSPLVQVQSYSDLAPRVPLFDTLVAFESYPDRTTERGRSAHLHIANERFTSNTHYPLALIVLPEPTLELHIKYHGQCFHTATVTLMLGHLRALLQSMVAAPNQRLTRLSMLTPHEQQQLLEIWNPQGLAQAQDLLVHHLVEAQVERTPEAIAVIYEDQQVSYAEINRRANQLAHTLCALGVGPEVPVGICLQRSVELLIGLLGILKAGGVCVPLEPSYPPARLAMMVADTHVPVLLTQQALLPVLPTSAARVLCLDHDWPVIAQHPPDNPASGVQRDHLAYIIYTSGSTGAPKGVGLSHGAISNYLRGIQTALPLTAVDRTLQKAPVSFDASIRECFWPLLAGARLIVTRPGGQQDPAYLLHLMVAHGITLIHFVPSMLPMFLEEPGLAACTSLQRVMCGGEALPRTLQERLLTHLDVDLYNVYGPTETTIQATLRHCERHSTSAIAPLGRPVASAQVYLLDPELQPVPVGIAGELYIGGPGLARGYLGHTALTAEKFLPHPFSTVPGARLYKTGDLARYLPDGTIEFLGRLDNQVKLRGYRIEPGEIEAALERHPSIRQAVVMLREDTVSDRRLVAYAVPSPGATPDSHTLRQFLQAQLPDYMLPSHFLFLDTLPLSPNGKLDRQALPAPDHSRPPLWEAFVAPRTPVEEILAGIWASVLRLEAVGIHDNFFALGGHSLLAMRIMSLLRKTFQVHVPLRAIFESPTVATLAPHITSGRQHPNDTPPLQPIPRTAPVPLTMTQEQLWDLDQLLPGAPFSNMPYAAQLLGPLNLTALEHSFHALVQRHEALRTAFSMVDGKPVQVIAATASVPFEVIDLSTLPPDAQTQHVKQHLRIAVLHVFDLQQAPLCHVRVLQLGKHEHLLMLIMHHIISDGWARGVLLHELGVLYAAYCQGQNAHLPALPLQYADYASWQQQWLHSAAGQAQLHYWLQQLHTPLPRLIWPTEPAHPPAFSLTTARHAFQLSSECTAALTRLSQQEGTTLFMTLVAAFTVLLYRYTGQEDIRVGTLAANRQVQDTEGIVGLFTNPLVLRTALHGNMSLRQVLQHVRAITLDAYAHQELPFEFLARTLERTGQCTRQELFQVMFVMQPAHEHTLTLPNIAVQTMPMRPVEASACDLVISIRQSPQGLEGLCIYKTALFKTSTVARFMEGLQHMIDFMINDIQLLVDKLQMKYQ